MQKYSIDTWKMDYEEHKGLVGTVPCSMYSLLLKYSLMDDPYIELNEYKATKYSRNDCDFYADFEINDDTASRKNIKLRFDGLDTLCKIYLNGTELGQTNNMHRTWEFDIKDFLVVGKNSVRVHIYSPVKFMEDMQNRHWLWNDANSMTGLGHIRKSFCMFGWDWAPKLPDMGIFRPVTLLAYDTARLEDCKIEQSHENGKVTLALSATLSEQDSSDIWARITHPCGKSNTVRLDGGNAEYEVASPEIWWPHGYGSQPLYEVVFYTKNGEEITDEKTYKIGLRTITLSTKPDKYGSEFCFVVNGIKIFSMGANYIPEDSILANITPERTEQLIIDCINANYNTIRVWGGGFYPHDFFYELCDKYGLIVWQDFMIACANIWLTKSFEENMRAEAIDNIRRIRHHACLGLLCGNNEMEDFIKNNATAGTSQTVRNDYIKLYEHILPDICEELAPAVFYRSSSPSSVGGFDDPSSYNKGDTHYWGCWHGNASFDSYRHHHFRFCSEYGFESFPDWKTICHFASEKNRNCFSRVMESHQKCVNGNVKLLGYLADHYLFPNSFENLVYASQILQADAIKYGVEHFRRFRGRCMGSLYWQLNDCWPVASWSSIDYFGRRKALHFAAARFHAPVLLSAHESGSSVTFNLQNEQLVEFSGYAEIKVKKTDFSELFSQGFELTAKALETKDFFSFDFADVIALNEEDCYLEYTLYGNGGNKISRQTFMFVRPKYFNFCAPNYKCDISGKDGNFKITVSADTYVKYLDISFKDTDLYLSDNYFDISCPEPITITATCKDKNVTAEALLASMTLRCVADIAK